MMGCVSAFSESGQKCMTQRYEEDLRCTYSKKRKGWMDATGMNFYINWNSYSMFDFAVYTQHSKIQSVISVQVINADQCTKRLLCQNNNAVNVPVCLWKTLTTDVMLKITPQIIVKY